MKPTKAARLELRVVLTSATSDMVVALRQAGRRRVLAIRVSSPPGTDEGARFIGQRSVSVDTSGNVTFAFKPKEKVGGGRTITATATNEFTGDTSEFSAPKKVVR